MHESPEPLTADFTAADGTVDRPACNAAHAEWFDNPPVIPGGGWIGDTKFTAADIDAEEAFDNATTVEEAIAAEVLTRATARRQQSERAARSQARRAGRCA
jgi:hypothetical protein